MAGDGELAELESLYRPLAESVRRLVDVTIRTQVDAATLAGAKEKIDCATKDLSAELMPGPFGVRHTGDGHPMAWGNVVIGLRNPVAPPLSINHGPDGLVWSEFTLGAPYEGPPGHVHGGVCAGVKTFSVGHLADAQGVTVQAEGVFFTPADNQP